MITQFDKLTLKKIRELLENQLNNSIENIKILNLMFQPLNTRFIFILYLSTR